MVAAKTLGIPLDDADRERLSQLAASEGGTPEELVKSWVLMHLAEAEAAAKENRESDEAIAQYERDGLSVPHHEVVAWMKSWRTPGELPCPKPRRK